MHAEEDQEDEEEAEYIKEKEEFGVKDQRETQGLINLIFRGNLAEHGDEEGWGQTGDASDGLWLRRVREVHWVSAFQRGGKRYIRVLRRFW